MCSARARTFGSPNAARSPVFESAQEAEDSRRVGLFAAIGDLRQDLFDGAELLGLVVNDEIALVTELFDVLAENPHAQRVEGANGGRRGRILGRATASGQDLVDPFPHLAGGFVGKCDGQYVARRDPLFDQAGDAKRDNPGLPGAGAGQDQNRAFYGFHGLPLLRI